MNPHTLREERVRARDVDGHGPGRRVDADDRFDLFLAHVLIDQEVVGLDDLADANPTCRNDSCHHSLLPTASTTAHGAMWSR